MCRLLGFFSKKLDPAQQKYSAFDRELFAVYAGIRHFRHLLEGRKFAVYTDHKPLTHLPCVRPLDGPPMQAAGLRGRVHE
jgi:hypothetical protein